MNELHVWIEQLGGYAGLPERYLVASKHGWLGADGFSLVLKHAQVFDAKHKGLARAIELYPEAGVTVTVERPVK